MGLLAFASLYAHLPDSPMRYWEFRFEDGVGLFDMFAGMLWDCKKSFGSAGNVCSGRRLSITKSERRFKGTLGCLCRPHSLARRARLIHCKNRKDARA
jgi:hypothetical protein